LNNFEININKKYI